MSELSLLFWILLPLPGYVVFRRIGREDADSGLMGAISLSYLYSLGLLSPVSILCYITCAPISVLAGAYVAAVAASLVEITRRHWWNDIGRLLIAGICFELLIIVADLIISSRKGSFLGGDARVHLARIRFLVDGGFSNLDPFVQTPYFFPIYHTNLLHALYASCTTLLGADHIEVWFRSQPWAKLLVSSGAYYMTWAVLGKRWAAWAAALCCLGIRGPFNYLNYPNQLSFFWLSPLIIGFAAQACRSTIRWTAAWKIAIASIIVGQFHGLFAIFSIMAIAPPLTVAAGVFFFTKRRVQSLKALACTAALFVGLPFPFISKYKSNPVYVAPVEDVGAIAKSGDFVPAGAGWLMRDPKTIPGVLGGSWWCITLLVTGTLIVLCGSARWPGLMVVGIMATSMIILYVPPVCTFFLQSFREEWIMERFGFYFVTCHQVLIPGALAFGLDRISAYGLIRVPLSVAALLLGLPIAGHQYPYDWTTYVNTSAQFSGAGDQWVETMKAVGTMLRGFVPPGGSILADPFSGIDLVALSDCHILASKSGSNGVLDQAERMEHLNILMHPETPWFLRRALLQKYSLRYFYPNPNIPRDWANGHFKRYERSGERMIVELEID